MTDLVDSVYINPYTDFGVKKLFGEEYNKDLLISFLNALLCPQSPIEDLHHLPRERLPDSDRDLCSVFDVYCTLRDGSRIIVEMQKTIQEYFKDRALYYATFPIREQAIQGEWNYQLAPVYTVGVLNFTFDDREEYFHHEVVLCDRKTQEQFYDKLTMIYLEMPKFNKKLEELTTELDKWLYLLKNLARLNDRPRNMAGKIFELVFEVARVAALNPDDRAAYQRSIKGMWDMGAAMSTQRNLGLVEGEKKGREENRFEMAQKLKALGVDLNTIAEASGFSVEEIQKL